MVRVSVIGIKVKFTKDTTKTVSVGAGEVL